MKGKNKGRIKTQTEYEREEANIKRIRQALDNKEISKNQAVAELCMVGFSPDRAKHVVVSWDDDFDRRFPS